MQGCELLGLSCSSQRPGSGQVTRRCCWPPPQASEHCGWGSLGSALQPPPPPPEPRPHLPPGGGEPAEAGPGPTGLPGGRLRRPQLAVERPQWTEVPGVHTLHVPHGESTTAAAGALEPERHRQVRTGHSPGEGGWPGLRAQLLRSWMAAHCGSPPTHPHTLLQLPVCHVAQGRRWQWRAGWGRPAGAQSSSRPELQYTGLQMAPRPQVVEHCRDTGLRVGTDPPPPPPSEELGFPPVPNCQGTQSMEARTPSSFTLVPAKWEATWACYGVSPAPPGPAS